MLNPYFLLAAATKLFIYIVAGGAIGLGFPVGLFRQFSLEKRAFYKISDIR